MCYVIIGRVFLPVFLLENGQGLSSFSFLECDSLKCFISYHIGQLLLKSRRIDI